MEPLLTETKNRFVLYPIVHHDIFGMYKKALSSFWVVEEVDLSKDVDDWENKLTPNEKKFITSILAFFAASDGIVNENLSINFHDEVQLPEAKSFYTIQMAIESVHSEMYSLMIDTFIKDPNEKEKSLNALTHYPCIKKKAEWTMKWMDKGKPFAVRLIAFSIVEGVFFSGAFASIFWLKERNLMPGLSTSNEFISRDESLHTMFAILLYTKIVNRIPEDKVHEIFREAVNIESEFITEAIPCSMLGMNSVLMIEYIQFVADRLLTQLSYEKIYNVHNPLQFMDRLNLENKNNFFEGRTTDYSKANVGNKSSSEVFDFSLDADF